MFAIILFSLLSSYLVYINLQIKVYETVILPVIFMGVKIGLSH
jgi:hypothetical protein